MASSSTLSTCLACAEQLEAVAGVTYASPCAHGRMHQLCFLERSLGQELVRCSHCSQVWAVTDWTKWVQAAAEAPIATRRSTARPPALLPAPSARRHPRARVT
ncbi:hypothetical protein T492DRAFT_898639 [Pavlovales sp. CCMP2436]|nr:hypothetical protein T492DRAFT_898639 [Pavlovales sp. CCMP2436]